ncbi:nuclear transport factor 2 family protein [Nocardioides houyundeii]|uniref:nuclear transport factor 2 family protein n=1 Tax=Nocardioides houyundeii TaxID=2045452 RepID=UPI000DF26E9D|nr:nuclear transport factor 2 family protein [Nocardioides houyundeii]
MSGHRPAGIPGTSPGARLVEAVATRDRDALAAVLADDVDFMGLTPRRSWEAQGRDEVATVLFDHWFTEQDRVEEVAGVVETAVADTRRIGYRFDLGLPEGPHVAEQQAYYRVSDGRIDYLRVICSGFRPRPAAG